MDFRTTQGRWGFHILEHKNLPNTASQSEGKQGKLGEIIYSGLEEWLVLVAGDVFGNVLSASLCVSHFS